MSDESIAERQAERKRNERWYGSWPAIREAIIAARGARECADVAFEEKMRAMDPRLPAVRMTQEATPAQLRKAERAVWLHTSFGGWLYRLIYGEPIDYTDDALPLVEDE